VNLHNEEISIQLVAKYLPEESIPMMQRYAFNYRFTLYNKSDSSWQLIDQSWQANHQTEGMVHQQHEDGIAGQHPIILAGHCLQASVALTIPVTKATLVGKLIFQNEQEERQQITTPCLVLDFDSRME
jgi:uncharacterized protein affecting Mg2+/Co2+ transport